MCVCGKSGVMCVYHSEILALDLLERQDVTHVDSTVKQIDLSPPDLYFLYFCVLMLCLYASGLTHLTTAVHVPFIKDHGTAVCMCAFALGGLCMGSGKCTQISRKQQYHRYKI